MVQEEVNLFKFMAKCSLFLDCWKCHLLKLTNGPLNYLFPKFKLTIGNLLLRNYP